jgi:hypothetical protein
MLQGLPHCKVFATAQSICPFVPNEIERKIDRVRNENIFCIGADFG